MAPLSYLEPPTDLNNLINVIFDIGNITLTPLPYGKYQTHLQVRLGTCLLQRQPIQTWIRHHIRK